MNTPTFTASGSKASTQVTLPKEVFGLKVEDYQLLKESYVAYQSNRRPNLAKTLKRGEVRGGGKKPWRQKGTGRARFGSSRNPIWRGGGIVFGPLGVENYKRKMNAKSRNVALRQALSLAASSGKLLIIETFKTQGKVKDTKALLSKIGASRKTLIVVSEYDELVKRATDNLVGVSAIYAKNINVVDILDADHVVVSKKSLELISQWLGDK